MGKHKIKGMPSIGIGCYYGGHVIYSGQYFAHKTGNLVIWSQADNDHEGNPDGNPAADIIVNKQKIVLKTSDGNEREWDVPVYKSDLKEIEKTIDAELEEFYSQYKKQPMFIKKTPREF